MLQNDDDDANRCGSSYWKAAKSMSSAKSKLSETGLEVAGCRHSIAQAAVNMTTGEQYAYPHFLHSQILLPLGIKYLWQDVICKYWPWATRLGQQKPQFAEAVEKVIPALSVMHAKAHAWDCQVWITSMKHEHYIILSYSKNEIPKSKYKCVFLGDSCRYKDFATVRSSEAVAPEFLMFLHPR